jgi:hypothetical protein
MKITLSIMIFVMTFVITFVGVKVNYGIHSYKGDIKYPLCGKSVNVHYMRA